MAVQDYKINYKSDFVLNINGDAGWAVPFCIKFWTGMPSQAYFVGFDGVKYVNCRVGDTPTQLLVMFDDHHLPIGKLMMQIAYHTTIDEFPGSVFDEVTNARDVIVTIDGTDYQVMLDFTGEDAPELEFDLPAYANEAERIQNELQRQQNEADRIAAELQREQATAAAVQGAENVNAQLSGNTLTVTNRQGVSTSVNTKGEQGEQGPVGPEGPQGEQGETGISIVSFTPKSETSTTIIYTVTFSDGHTQDVPIPKGAKGDTGATGPQGQKGDTGVSITAFTYASETETDMIYTVTFSDSTTQQVSIPKGAKGDTGPQGPVGPQGPQGPMGDVAVITPEQQAAFTMYSTTGQNTNGPMTQKAVTDEINKLKGAVGEDVATEFSLVGNNNTGVQKVLHLEAGRQYKLSTSMTAADYSTSSIPNGLNVYSFSKIVNGTGTNLFVTFKGTDTVPSEYVFTAEDADYYSILIRANSGTTIDFELTEYYDSNLLVGKKEFSSVSVDTDEFGFYNNTNGFRIYFGKRQRLDCYKFPVRVVVTGVPSGVTCGLSTFENYSDTLNPYASNDVESTSWGTTDHVFSNPLSNYLKLNFKSTASGSNPKITNAQLASIKSDVRVSITSCIKLGGVHGENYAIAYEGGSLEEKIASLDIESSLLKKEMTLNDFFCSWSTYRGAFVKNRIRCALAIPKMPIRVIISGVPSGFQASPATNYSAADAFNQSVYEIEGYTWNILDCVFTIPAPYLCIGFRKGDNVDMDDEDMATIKESVRVTISPWDDDINNADIITVNGKERTIRYLRNLRRPNYSLDGQYTPGLTPFTLLHFSDLHSDRINLKRIVEYKNFYSEYIDDTIGTGDLIRNKFDQSFDFWSEVGADNILISTGNHEYWNGSNYTTVTPLQVYNKYMAPFRDNWGETVAFPTDAGTNGYSYYYKDYPTRNIRLFVLDSMANMSRNRDGVQAAWLATELENARVAGRHVICAIHIGSTQETPYNNSFTSLRAVFGSEEGGINAPSFAEFYTLRDAVDTFISNGGKFVCWIAGHRHVDTVALLNKQSGNEWVPTSQFSVHVATASGGEFATGSNAGHGDADTGTNNYNDGHCWWIIPRGDDCDRTDNTKQQDCFNIYSVDTEKQLLRIFRVGSDVDKNGRHKGSLLYDYANRQVLYCD